MEPGAENEMVLLKVDSLLLAKGTRFCAYTGGGGGYGPPWERNPLTVRSDVIDKYVSRIKAADVYRVFFMDGSMDIDKAKTSAARSDMQEQESTG